MCCQRSSCWMQGMSLSGVSLARALHSADVTALALVGTTTPAATHSGTSHDQLSRDPRLLRMCSPLVGGCGRASQGTLSASKRPLPEPLVGITGWEYPRRVRLKLFRATVRLAFTRCESTM